MAKLLVNLPTEPVYTNYLTVGVVHGAAYLHRDCTVPLIPQLAR
jgi:hypothetical protein